ncbi:putative short-chain dehydrogenase [Actinoplanes missouriensis 431]|uniref:Putative short-chain dehydrogenase n=1 Tax=Actinoplanes missouriensis (strain ATCC 14538 / DSM 43046 / CBS 188.64 / JCM 3121 / NBRC 102363 / NCIMB 12654 / NRRL B-3342 / UNCC 431) TaxID=512565 RepID=I0GYB0_ACTM4|nr:SDR family oxidoreductase [Actinoplanes missouriensis]BAL85747.1 putative short-chain dehydrogenase [Actinoplanes missouriensis 431]
MTRLAVVTGGGTGIGKATAGMLAGEGYDVIIVGRRAEVLADAVKWIGPQASAVTADVADPAQVARVVEAVGDRDLDVLVNNAGAFVAHDESTLAGVAERWRANLDSNVLSAVLMTTALLPRLRRPGGKIILTSSIAAQRGGGGPYSAAKAALHGYGLDLATSLGPEGITANVISPGYITDSEFFVGRMTPEGHQARIDATLVKRAGVPGDIAETVRWLVGPGGGFVTGQIINVNGGSVLGR